MDDGNAREPDLYRTGRRDDRGVADAAGVALPTGVLAAIGLVPVRPGGRFGRGPPSGTQKAMMGVGSGATLAGGGAHRDAGDGEPHGRAGLTGLEEVASQPE